MGSKICADPTWGIDGTIPVGGKSISTDEAQKGEEEERDTRVKKSA